jgi:hypothetical protein
MRMMSRLLRTAKPAWRHCRCSSDGTKVSSRLVNAGDTSERLLLAYAYAYARHTHQRRR